jgi:phosphatidylglycerol:prolipoprotein diacylglycerol transferase
MHPVLFTIPGIDLPIYSYGVMLGLSLVVGWYLVMYLGRKDGLPKDKLASCYVWCAISAMIGSRLLYIVTNLDEFADGSLFDLVNVRKGGLVAYGGFLGGFIGSWIYLRRVKLRLTPWADIVVPTLASGLGITRIGCFLYGCDYGKPIGEDAPGWLESIALKFPNWNIRFADLQDRLSESGACGMTELSGSPAFHHHVSMGLVESSEAWSALVYPTQIMEVVNGWILFAILMIARRYTKFRGQIFLIFTMYYGITRSLMEMVRGDTQRGGIGEFSTSQIIGAATFLAAAAAFIFMWQRAKRDPEAAMDLGAGAYEEPESEQSDKKRKKKKRKKRKK